MVLARIVAPYPDPAAFLEIALGGGFGQDSLAKLAGLDRGRRITAASQFELQLMRGPAPLAAIGTPVVPEFFSTRVSCHIFQPLEFGADLGSLAYQVEDVSVAGEPVGQDAAGGHSVFVGRPLPGRHNPTVGQNHRSPVVVWLTSPTRAQACPASMAN